MKFIVKFIVINLILANIISIYANTNEITDEIMFFNEKNKKQKNYKECKICDKKYLKFDYCPYDGMKLTSVKIANFCNTCTQNYPAKFLFCPDCGRQLKRLTASLFQQGMIYIEKGDFVYSETGKKEILNSFFIDKFEVTNYEFEKFTKKARVRPDLSSADEMPITDLTYYEADNYCKSLYKRLCTEKEWEKAAQGSKNLRFSYGNFYSIKKCRSGKKYNDGAAIVGSHQKCLSEYDVADMTGNAAEMTSTIAEGRYYKIKGGSWFDSSYYSRNDKYQNLRFNEKKPFIGFRCCKSVLTKKKDD